MYKKDLLRMLKSVPDDAIILVACDEEWNKLNVLYDISKTYVATEHGGEYSAVADEDIDEYEEENLSTAYVLWG